MLTSIEELLEAAVDERTDDSDRFAVLYMLGSLPDTISVDGTVIQEFGVVNGDHAYRIEPLHWTVKNRNDLQISDSNENWLSYNDDEVLVPEEYINLVIVANRGGEHSELRTNKDASKFVMYPAILSD